MAAPIIGGLIKYVVTMNTAQAQQGVQALRGSMDSLAASAQQSFRQVYGAALGPYANPTGMVTEFMDPIGNFLRRYQSSINVGAAGLVGMGGVARQVRGGRDRFEADSLALHETENLAAAHAMAGGDLDTSTLRAFYKGRSSIQQRGMAARRKAQDVAFNEFSSKSASNAESNLLDALSGSYRMTDTLGPAWPVVKGALRRAISNLW